MKKFVLFNLLCFLSPLFVVFSQNAQKKIDYEQILKSADSLYNSENPTADSDAKAIELYRQVASYLNDLKEEPLTTIGCFKKIADIYLGGGQYKKAIEYYAKTIDANKASGLNDILHDYQAKLYMGSAYYQSNIIDSARYYFEQAAAYARQKNDLVDISFLYNSLGVIYYESANFLQAKNYFEQAIPQDDNLKTNDPATYVSLNTNIATCLKFLGKEQEALNLYHSLLPLDISSEKLSYNIGQAHLLLKQYDSALYYYANVNSTNNVTAVKKMNDIGRIYTEQGAWSRAEKVFDSAILLNKQNMPSSKNKELAYSYLYKAFLAEKQGLIDEAIFWCNNSLQILHFDFRWEQPTDLPQDETRVISPVVFFEVLRKKAELLALQYRSEQDKKKGESSLATYMKAIRIASFIKASFDNDDARLFFKENHSDIYSDAIQVAYELIEDKSKKAKDHFLQIMESYKGSIMYQNLVDLELKKSPFVEPAVIREEKQLKQSLAAYTARLNNDVAAEDIPVLQKRIIELEVEISRLQKLYEEYPEYKVYRRQSDANYVTVDAVRSQLDDYTAVISFLHAKDNIYGLAITSSGFVVQKIAYDSVLDNSINKFIASLYEHNGGERFDGYNSSSYIYQKLITPFYHIAGQKKRWVVLPDGILNFMPFNALQEFPDEREYLAESKIISNHYSLMLLLDDSRTVKANKQTPVIFAPFIDKSTMEELPDLPPLFSSVTEVDAVNGRAFTAEKATKQAFMNVAATSSVIHLATHAASDIDSSNNACIYFYPSELDPLKTRLYAPEVYNLELHDTKLVILSACETARGKNSSGEGLLSLARAFIYAGSDGVVSTFWKTEDKVGGYIMQRLHYHLQHNKSPDEALFLAKKDFLNSNQFDEHYKTPNYWSNFIYIGNLSPLTAAYVGYDNVIVGLFIGLIFLFFVVWLKLRHREL